MKRVGIRELESRLRILRETFDSTTSRKISREITQPESHLVFALSGEFCAWPVVKLSEVVVNRKIFPVPAQMEEICGVINHRDSVLTVLSLHRLLNLSPASVNEKNELLITTGLVVNTAILTDGILGFVDVDTETIKSRPISLDSKALELIAGEFIHRGKLVMILNHNVISG